jgi:tetraacyldisaccharide 4'-kinase
VGNITVGGTGKTEAVAMVCWMLRSLGLKPAVLSRGYRRRSREKILVVSDGSGPSVAVSAAGDEPYLLAERLSGIPVVVGADRLASGRLAVKSWGCDVLVLDDGFQRRDQVHRDLDLLLVDAADPFGGGQLLPAGRLREPLAALAEANALVITRADQYDPEPVAKQLARLAPQVAVYTAQHAPVSLSSLNREGLHHPLSWLNGKKVVAVSGIARPAAFLRTLETLGAKVIRHFSFRDHHWFSEADRTQILHCSQDDQAEIVTTSKDAVRLAEHSFPGWILEVQFKIMKPKEGLLPLIEKCLKEYKTAGGV